MNWLKDQRKRIGLTQEDLAERISNAGYELTRGTLAHWEQDRYHPPFDDPKLVDALSSVFNMSVRQILIEVGFNLSEGGVSTQSQIMLEIFESIPEDRREMAIKILKQLTAEETPTA